MNVYDFDKTIYNGDSTLDFWRYCARKYPKTLLAFPEAVLYAALFRLKRCSREQFKEQFYVFLQYVPDVAEETRLFWDSHLSKIKSFYLRMQRSDDLVISASPDFLIDEACKRLRISHIASLVNPFTGKLESPNCRGEEKLRRFREQYSSEVIECFYSDSVSDIFLAREAKEAFLVKDGVIKKWSI